MGTTSNDMVRELLLAKNTASFTGHRPSKLGGYDMKDTFNMQCRMEIYRLVQWLVESKNVYRFISGGALGWDQLAFWAVEKLRHKYPHIENIVAVPFADQPLVWKDKESKDLYYQMLNTATKVVYVDTEPHYGTKGSEHGRYDIRKLEKRNIYMVDKSRYLIAGFNGSSGGTKNCMKYARTRRRIVYQINPNKNFELKVWDYEE